MFPPQPAAKPRCILLLPNYRPALHCSYLALPLQLLPSFASCSRSSYSPALLPHLSHSPAHSSSQAFSQPRLLLPGLLLPQFSHRSFPSYSPSAFPQISPQIFVHELCLFLHVYAQAHHHPRTFLSPPRPAVTFPPSCDSHSRQSGVLDWAGSSRSPQRLASPRASPSNRRQRAY